MSQPSFMGELAAILREAGNDVRQTAHEVAFGRPEHAMGVGTPMNPTPQEVTTSREAPEPEPER